jgi:iron complex outermembrane receptor protein
VPLEEADRSVAAFPVRDQALVSNTLSDFLHLDSSLDLRQRAPNGVQSDLSIRGASFGQTLVLLNGQRMNDVQSGHHNLDIPVTLESVSRIEVLRGAGSVLYGSDAVGGVVNIITELPEAPEMRFRTAVGNFGVNQQRGSLTGLGRRSGGQVSFSRDFSSGFAPNRDYRNLSFASAARTQTSVGTSEITLAYSDRPFGADQFYGNFNSWENTKTWFAGLRQSVGEKTEAAFSFRRHSDLFVLYRDRPAVFANHHSVESYQVSLRRREEIAPNARLFYGVEGLHDSIESNNLGKHDRARAAGYASFDMRALKRFSFSLGLREEIHRSLDSQLSPSVAAGAWLTPYLKLRGSVSRAFRLPTYTDLYYHDPANRGSPDLRPEHSWSYEGGLDWNGGGKLRGAVTVFQRRERDGIDYIRRSPADIWRAANIQNLRFTGVEASLHARTGRASEAGFSYTGLHGVQNALSTLQSKYAFNYPSQTGLVTWQASAGQGLMVRTRLGVLSRLARDPYALWDVYVARTGGRVRPFLQFTNLTGTSYQEIIGVRMPGRGVVGGIEVAYFARRR